MNIERLKISIKTDEQSFNPLLVCGLTLHKNTFSFEYVLKRHLRAKLSTHYRRQIFSQIQNKEALFFKKRYIYVSLYVIDISMSL